MQVQVVARGCPRAGSNRVNKMFSIACSSPSEEILKQSEQSNLIPDLTS